MKVGILGAGQLARMLALAAYPLGIEPVCYAASETDCALSVAQGTIGDFDDHKQLSDFCHRVDIVTFENENIPLEHLTQCCPEDKLHPNLTAIVHTQDRLTEKQLFQSLNIPTAPFVAVNRLEDINDALRKYHSPVVVKTRRFGYDGKGQYAIAHESQITSAFPDGNHPPLIAEQKILFQKEVSQLAVRSQLGEIRFYPLTENWHHQGILRQSRAPINNNALQSAARSYTKCLLEKLNYVGVLAVEFFVTEQGLLANEYAPRVHNSGHWTIEGALCSQFGNHLRAICGYPLGNCRARGYSMMLNCLGAMPDPKQMLQLDHVVWHDYGKPARPNRKVGHMTLNHPDLESFDQQCAQLIRSFNFQADQ